MRAWAITAQALRLKLGIWAIRLAGLLPMQVRLTAADKQLRAAEQLATASVSLGRASFLLMNLAETLQIQAQSHLKALLEPLLLFALPIGSAFRAH